MPHDMPVECSLLSFTPLYWGENSALASGRADHISGGVLEIVRSVP
jgi:hypothetical protein